jgi:uncharacterized protein (DUF433 family)
LELISADSRVMHGQAVIAGTRVPVSVILDCLAAGMTAEEITAKYPTVTTAGVRAAAALRRGPGMGGTRPGSAVAVRFKLDETLPSRLPLSSTMRAMTSTLSLPRVSPALRTRTSSPPPPRLGGS